MRKEAKKSFFKLKTFAFYFSAFAVPQQFVYMKLFSSLSTAILRLRLVIFKSIFKRSYTTLSLQQKKTFSERCEIYTQLLILESERGSGKKVLFRIHVLESKFHFAPLLHFFLFALLTSFSHTIASSVFLSQDSKRKFNFLFYLHCFMIS